MGFFVDDSAPGFGQRAQAFGVKLTEQGLQVRLRFGHTIGFDEADVEGFLGGVVIVDVADGDSRLAGDVVALADKQAQGHPFDGRLVQLDSMVPSFGILFHSTPRAGSDIENDR